MELAKYKLFSLLEPEKLHNIKNNVEECTFSPGQDIICHGTESTAYYIIKSGSALVLKKMLGEELEQVEILGSGHGFGEDALINNTKQGMTVRTLEETTVWKVSRTDFDSHIKSAFLQEISPEDMNRNGNGGYTLLDVRMDFEFEEEHIPGAVNIPLDELRMRYPELDQEREYYVYCLVGCRSATAAFNLSSQGFRARNIKGGIMNWTGPLEKKAVAAEKSFKPT